MKVWVTECGQSTDHNDYEIFNFCKYTARKAREKSKKKDWKALISK